MKERNRQIFGRISIAAALMYGVTAPSNEILANNPNPFDIDIPVIDLPLTIRPIVRILKMLCQKC